jgi:hypothetical protein
MVAACRVRCGTTEDHVQLAMVRAEQIELENQRTMRLATERAELEARRRARNW